MKTYAFCSYQILTGFWLLSLRMTYAMHNCTMLILMSQRWLPVAQYSLQMERERIFNRSEANQHRSHHAITDKIPRNQFWTRHGFHFRRKRDWSPVKSVRVSRISRMWAHSTGGRFFDEYAKLLFTNPEKIVIECGFPVSKRFPHLPWNSFSEVEFNYHKYEPRAFLINYREPEALID